MLDLKREGHTCEMSIPPNRIQRLAFMFGIFCVAWVNVAIGMPVEAVSTPKKNGAIALR
jgi:hypothetical protein